jgi:thymidylate kinase
LRVLHPVDEALLLVVRTQLESRWLDPIAVRYWTALRQKAADDLAALAPRVDRAALRERAAQFFSPELAGAIADQLDLDGQTFSLQRIRARIARELSAYRMYGGAEALLRMIGRTAIWAMRAINKRYFKSPRLWGRRTPGGGCVISFIGVDGSGKSTSLHEISNWLAAETDVMTCYFGTGEGKSSLLFRPFKATASLAARLVRTRLKGASHGTVSDRPPGPAYSVLFAILAIVVALEKRRKLIATQRAASRGFVVITDRYPQNEIKHYNDGPLLHRLPRSPTWLIRFEHSIYTLAQRAPPDLVIKLHVGAETIARREPNMIPSIINQRIAWLSELKFSPARVVSIDATKPLDEVIRTVKREIWSVL